MGDILHVLASGRYMGQIEQIGNQLTFLYDDDWRQSNESYPLSLSMPLTATRHGHEKIASYLWGLLPDNEDILRSWGRRFHVSHRNPFALLSEVGEDCPGAVQMVREERLEDISEPGGSISIQWLDQEEICHRIRQLVRDHSATRQSSDEGQFSLPGAQPKTAFYRDPVKQRWGIPSGTTPTTHILKPAIGYFNSYEENEHFCLSLARHLGLASAVTEIKMYDDIPVIVVERYDRQWKNGVCLRVHQEDLCQANACMPQDKYENRGGPGATDILRCIRENSIEAATDERRFIEALIFNWIIAGTDAHAKNYSLLIGDEGKVRFAPLYDISSALPYPDQIYLPKAKFAMKIGDEYRLSKINRRAWCKLAKQNNIKEDTLFQYLNELVVKTPEACQHVFKNLPEPLAHNRILKDLHDQVIQRSEECLKQLSKGSPIRSIGNQKVEVD